MKKYTMPVWLLALLFMQCSHAVGPSENGGIVNLTPIEKRIVASSNTFGLDLFRTVNLSEQNNNVFVSPLSVSMALGMTLNGANGSTRDSIQHTLGFSGILAQDINETYQSLNSLLPQLDPKVTFQIANSIWYRSTFSVEQSFLNVNRQYFNADVQSLDFSSPNAADIINNWVDVNTNGKIRSIIDPPIPAYMVMYLINAIYFKGTWTYEFVKDQTKDDHFYGAGGAQLPCKMMAHEAKHGYGSVDGAQVLDMSYGNEGYSMTVILPPPDSDIDAFITLMDAGLYERFMSSLREQTVDVFLPRFRLEYKILLNDALCALGMKIAFAGNADFTNINRNGGLCISEVNHKTFVEVNEEGTEAAAVTEVGFRVTSGNGGPTVPVFRADRPFVFVIREHESGTILFIGKIVEPVL